MATAGSFCLFCENGSAGYPATDADAGVLRSRRARERGDEDGGGDTCRAQIGTTGD